MLNRMTLPTAMANAQTPAIAITERCPTAPARIGTMIRNPLPKIEARGVVVALVSEFDCAITHILFGRPVDSGEMIRTRAGETRS